MPSSRFAFLLAVLLGVVLTTGALADARSVGQVIDDTAITTQIKTKLTADTLSNLKNIEVKTEDGVVTLNGTVDSFDRAQRALQIATGVKGVRGIVNNLHVAGTTVDPVATAPSQDAVTGVVAQVDPVSGRLVLQDGRVLQATPGTVIWQIGSLNTVRPGTQVYVRGAAPLATQPSAFPR